MRRFLSILGAIFLGLIVLVVVVVAVLRYHGKTLDESSRTFVEENVPRICASWDPQLVLSIASNGLARNIAQNRAVFDQSLAKFSELGSFQALEDVRGEAGVHVLLNAGIIRRAMYSATGKFEKGSADLKVELLMEQGVWRLQFFHLSSPLLLQ